MDLRRSKALEPHGLCGVVLISWGSICRVVPFPLLAIVDCHV